MPYLYNKTFRSVIKAVFLGYGCPFDKCPYPLSTCKNCCYCLKFNKHY